MLHEHHFRAMNTEVGVWVWSTDADGMARIRLALEHAEHVFGTVEAELSRFRNTSALSRLNRAAGCGPQPVPPLLWSVLCAAVNAASESGGIYDPTLGRTMEQLGYDRSFETIERTGAAPTASPHPRRGSWRRVQLNGLTRSVSLPADLAIDLGGIAKGWTVDRVALDLATLGPVLVDAGGDLRVIGTVAGELWPIGVQDPFEPERDRTVVRLRGGALATSSVGGRQWRRGDRSLHHVIDPRTGTSANSGLHAVTVHAPTATTADVAAKVVLVLGREAGAAYLRERGFSATVTGGDGVHTIVGDFPFDEAEHHDSYRCG